MPSTEHEAVFEALSARIVPAGLTALEHRERIDDFGRNMIRNRSMPSDVRTGTLTLAGHRTDRVETPGVARDGVILFYHGGGYVAGLIELYHEFAGRLSRATRMAVLLPEYRLAPEHPFPAAVEDCLSAYKAVISQGFDPADIVLGGDSCGAGLVAATLLSAKEQGLPLPAGAFMISPWVDLTMSGLTVRPGVVNDPAGSLELMQVLAEAYAAKNASDPHASPIFADLSGLPPLLIMVGTRELLLDDARRLNARARESGVVTDYHEGEGLIHIWPVVIPQAPESDDALARIGTFIGSLAPRRRSDLT